MTWGAYDSGLILEGSQADDPGMVMLWLMRNETKEIQRDYILWLDQRDEHGIAAVHALFSTATADKLKESYLDYVARYCEEVGRYEVMFSTIEISEVEE